MTLLSPPRLRLLALAREAGDRLFNPHTGICLIQRDTLWYAIALLCDEAPERRALGEKLARSARSEDGTHTPATMLAMLLAIPDRLSAGTRAHLKEEVARELVRAAETQWRDGNVNHPLGAYCTLILGGELTEAPWATELGCRRLSEFRRLTGDRRFRFRRQAEMSEYNSLTYSALDVLFLALIARYAQHPEAQALGRFMEHRLWIDIALHFHAPSGQFAGPHSRSYQDDSTGGFSALHGTLAAASGREIFLAPELCVRFNHPSSLLQGALAAIVPMQMPEEAVHLAWEKPFPFLMRKTTYCEQYHENSRRRDGDSFAFDDEVYPGGLRELTTYMTEEFALGSASLPYVNAGHADSLTLRIRRASPAHSMEDFRSAYTRGVYNGAILGERNRCHTTGTEIDESYVYEEGRAATYQHRDRAIVLYAPKRAGHRGVKSFRLQLIFGYFAPFDELSFGGEPVGALPARKGAAARLCFRDAGTLGAVIPLESEPRSGTSPVTLSVSNDHLIYSLENYDGSPRDLTREEISRWRTGFVLRLARASEFPSFASFVEYTGKIHAGETVTGGVRNVKLTAPDGVMAALYDPGAERFLSRTWNGEEEEVEHLSVAGGIPERELLSPMTLFGSEALGAGD